MATPNINQNFTTQWGFEASDGSFPSATLFDSSTLAFEPITDTLGYNQTISHSSAIMGRRWDIIERSRITSEAYSGTITLDCTPLMLTMFLPYIMGHAPAEPAAYINQQNAFLEFDYSRSGNASDEGWLFRNCSVTKATFKPGGNGFIQMALDVVARTGSHANTFVNADSVVTTESEPYANYEATLAIAGISPVFASDWELTIEQGIEVQAHNSLTANRVRLGKAAVSLNANIEWTSANESAIYDIGAGGISAILDFTKGTPDHDCTFTLAKLLVPNTPFTVQDGDSRWNMQGTAMAAVVAGTNIISIVNDSVT